MHLGSLTCWVSSSFSNKERRWDELWSFVILDKKCLLLLGVGLSQAVLKGREADWQQQGFLQTLQGSQRFHQETRDLEGSTYSPGALKTVRNDICIKNAERLRPNALSLLLKFESGLIFFTFFLSHWLFFFFFDGCKFSYRFSYEGRWKQKLQTYVDFSLDALDLTQYVIGPKQSLKRYNLYGVSVSRSAYHK